MRIDEWFDPRNKEHITAYKQLQDTGIWPKDVIPDNMEFVLGWQILVMNKIADCWINHILKSQDEYDLIQAVFLEYREEINMNFNVDEEFIQKFNLRNY